MFRFGQVSMQNKLKVSDAALDYTRKNKNKSLDKAAQSATKEVATACDTHTRFRKSEYSDQNYRTFIQPEPQTKKVQRPPTTKPSEANQER